MTAVKKPDGRRTRHEKAYRVRIRLVPAPAGHDFKPMIEALEAIGRRHEPKVAR